MEPVKHQIGPDTFIEIRRCGDMFEFRPIYNPDPQTVIAAHMNALYRTDGSWAFVPEHLEAEARRAFESRNPSTSQMPSSQSDEST